MQTFSALLAGQRAAGANGTRNGGASSTTQDDAGASSGFDQMLQAQGARSDSRSSSPSPASRTPESSRADGAQRPRDSGPSRPSQDASQNDSKATEAKPRDNVRAEARDDAPREPRSAETSDTQGGEASAPADDDATATATAEASPTPAANDAAAPALPEQLLALLNGLAGATAAAPTATTDALPAALAPTAPDNAATGAQGATTAKPTLPALPTALPATTPATPAEGDATAAFAVAMGAAVSADGDANAPDATFDTGAIGEVGDTAATPPLSVSNATTHPLSRATVAAVMANQPLGVDKGFEDGFGSRIAWLADQKIGHAEIRVTPDHLGTIDVRLQLDGNRVNAEFNSAQAEVRHALESSLPRLRDMLGQQGLQLGHADVGQRQPGQQQAPANGQPGPLGGDGADSASHAGWTPGPAVRASRGLLDEYA